MPTEPTIRAQVGPQRAFQRCPAEIAIFGGAAGGGKSFGLLMEPLRNVHIPSFGAVIFRRNATQVTSQGGLWDQSCKIYPSLGGIGSKHRLEWHWPDGGSVMFRHLDQENDVHAYQGAEIPLICFDEITHFTEYQFFYLFSRNRTMCGVPPYMRATCNPDPDSFVSKLIAWWIDPNTGLAIPERSGVIRYFLRISDEIVWGESAKELTDKYGDDEYPRSFTFIPSKVQDNKLLLKADPQYIGRLKSMSLIDRERLLNGNWKIRPAAGNYFKAIWFEIITAAPASTQRIRYWDRAGTEKRSDNDPDWTVGVLMAKTAQRQFVVEDVVRLQGNPLAVERAILNTASRDGKGVQIGLEQDPGQAGKADVGNLIRALAGYNVRACPVSKDKETRAKPVSAQAEAGNVKIVKGPWNDAFLRVLENFPPEKDKGHDDDVDALSGAFNALTTQGVMMLI